VKILVLGGSGGTGQKVVELAKQAGHDVHAPRHAECDATKAADVERAVQGKDAVVVLLSPKTKTDPVRSQCAAALAAAKGVPRIIFVSSGGVGDSIVGAAKTSFVFAKIIIPLALKRQFEDAALAEQTLKPLGATVIRPMQLVDAERKSEAVAINPDEKSPSAKISREQLARFIVKELETKAHLGKMPVVYG
jgi:uncharacterized protein YbjT (DUF2867 family)